MPLAGGDDRDLQARLRILYLAPFLPSPPDKGERTRAFHQIRHLAERHELHLLCLTTERIEAERLAPLEHVCASVYAVPLDRRAARLRAAVGFLAGAPSSVAGLRSRRFDRALARSLGAHSFDCIFVFSSSMAEHAPPRQAAAVVDFVDVDSELPRQVAKRRRAPAKWFYRLEAERLARHEAATADASDVSIFVSEAEADLFRRRVPTRSVSVIPNGVDLDYFAPIADRPFRHHPAAAVFTGTMNYEPNVDAVLHFHRDIFPLVKRRFPSLRFHIVGRDPIGSVRRLAREPQITVTGPVPDVRPYLQGAAVMVAPFRLGRGIQNKILEAMAAGVPVVGTSLAFQGLQSIETAGVRVADRPEAFAKEMLDLIETPSWHRECSEKSRRYVERHHRWDDHNAALSRILRDVSWKRSAPNPEAPGKDARR